MKPTARNWQKKIAPAILLAVSALSFGCTETTEKSTSSHMDYYINAQTGSDSNPGTTPSEPFKTIKSAIAAIQNGAQQNSITVHLASGDYRLTETLTIDSELSSKVSDSLIFISEESGEKARIMGSVSVPASGWEVADAANQIYKTHVPNALPTRQLYVNGMRGIRARSAEYPAGFLPNYDPTNANVNGIQYDLSSGMNPTTWSNVSDIEAVIHTQWKMMTVPVVSINTAVSPNLITMESPAWDNSNLYLDDTGKPGIWSFWRVSYFENAREFIDQPGEWYLDASTDTLYFKLHAGMQNMENAQVELPQLEQLVTAQGSASSPIENISFQNISFEYATWNGPSGSNGYVDDQSGFHVVGSGHSPNTIGHVRNVVRTPGNLSFAHAHHIEFSGCDFMHLGGVALDFGAGSQHNHIANNRFIDISSAAVQLGVVSMTNAQRQDSAEITHHNTITNNLIRNTGADFVDAAGIMVGFTAYTDISHNTISNVPWAGIAMGWGWGLLDTSGFPGLNTASWHMWKDTDNQNFTVPTPNSHNRIAYNYIDSFLQNRWDGGAIYTTGQQGSGPNDPLVLEGNVGINKRAESGGNIFYTDGGSRYIQLTGNLSYNNLIGNINLGPVFKGTNLVPREADMTYAMIMPYGGEQGGCRTYGDIVYDGNYWGVFQQNAAAKNEWDKLKQDFGDLLWYYAGKAKNDTVQTDHTLYSKDGFFNICPFFDTKTNRFYPTNLQYTNNHDAAAADNQLVQDIINKAGRRE